MKSDVIEVSSREDRIDLVLQQAEKTAAYRDLSPRSALHLRLLTEEMMCLMRAITQNVNGEFWIESEKRDEFALHLKVMTNMDYYKREQLLSVASSGENEAHRGFMGKIRAFFEPMEGLPLAFEPNPEGAVTDSVWSMRMYQKQIEQYMQQHQEGAEEAWDELEKSVISHLADDVKIRIEGPTVEMTVLKSME